MRKKEYEQSIAELSEKVLGQSKIIESLQSNLNEEKIVLKHLESYDER
jgi:uncharacterized coiled-coil protein SlyX